MGSQPETVLVTGGSGFLGGWCLAELLRRGYRVRTTVRDISRESRVRAVIAAAVPAVEDLAVFAADLRNEDGWEHAVRGCDYVLHVASPFPPAQPKDPDELIVPARDGTLRVLRAALDAGVARVVLTSSVAAVGAVAKSSSQPLDEQDWTDLARDGLSPYVRSKTIAERAAWDLVRDAGESKRLAVVNPSAILGPALSEDRSFSLEMIERLLKGMPGVPHIGFNIVDVRDVADLHIKAMLAPEAGGERFVAATQFRWMAEVAEVLRDRLGQAAAKVPKRRVPNLLVRGMGLFDPTVRSISGQLGKKTVYSSEKATSLLGWSPRPVEETIVDCAQSMIDLGAV
jgi:dihydroflavonol-4-reductase